MTAFLRKYGIWLLAGLTFLTFLPSVTYEQIPFMDDSNYVFANPYLHLDIESVKKLISTPILELFTPLQMASYLVDYAIAGLKPWIYHLHNILWHVLAACMVWKFFRELGIHRITALFCAAAFAIHPQRVESVVWISERKDVLATTFFVAAMCFFLYGRRHNKPISIAALCCMLAAMMSKPQALLLPPVLYLLEVHRTRRWFSMEHVKAVLPYCILSVIYGTVVKKMIQSSVTALNSGERPLIYILVHMTYNYLRFAVKTFCPAGMIPLYPFIVFSPALFITSFAGLAATVAILASVWYKKREFFLYDILPMLLCFGGIILPVSGIILFSNADFADRYSYIPSIFLWGAAGMVLDRIRWQKFRHNLKICAVYLLITVVSLELYMPAWKNNLSVLTVSCLPRIPNYWASVFLGCHMFYLEKPEEAMQAMQKLSTDSFRSQKIKNKIVYLRKLADTVHECQTGNSAEALPELRKIVYGENFSALDLSVVKSMALKTLAVHELENNNTADAAKAYSRLSKEDSIPEFDAEFYRGLSFALQKDYESAVKHFQKAHQLNPEDENIIRNLRKAKALEKSQNQ